MVNAPYLQLLATTIAYLEQLKASGVNQVVAAPAILQALSQPKAPARPPSPPSPVIPATHATRAPRPAASSSPARPPTPTPVPATPASARDDAQGRVLAMAELRRQTLPCQICPHLVKSRQQVVFGVGDPNAALLFVGEAPGADEDAQGEPFVGKAGQLLTRIIQTMGLSRERVYIANILKCRPDTPGQTAGNRKPTSEEMQTCLPHLLRQIDIIQPQVIVALGATAVEGLLGKTVGITKLRGHFQSFRGIPTMPTYHPAYLLRNQSLATKREVWEDMLQVMEKLQLPISAKQRAFFLKP